MHLVEQVGSGIGRIKELMKEAKLSEPIFQKEGIFTVILQRPIKTTQKATQKSTQKTTQKILQLIEENNLITTIEMADKLEISRSAVAKQMAKLKNQGIVVRIGSDKSGKWEIIKE